MMDDPAEPGDIKLCNFFLRNQNSSSPVQFRRQNQSARYMRYTKLPQFDFESKVKWPVKTSYVLQPRLRRIVTINDEENVMRMAQSLRSELGVPPIEKKALTKVNTDKLPPPKQLARSSRYSSPEKEITKPPPNPWSSVPSRYLKQYTELKPSARQNSIIINEKSFEKSNKVKTKEPDGVTKPRRPADPQVMKNRNVSIKTNINGASKMIVQSVVSKKVSRPILNKDVKAIRNKSAEITHLNTEISSHKQDIDMFKGAGKHSVKVILVPQNHKSKHPPTVTVPVKKKDPNNELDMNIGTDLELKEDKLPIKINNNKRDVDTDDNMPNSKIAGINNTNPNPEKKDVSTEMNIQQINSFIQTIDLSNSHACKLRDMNVETDPEPEKKDVLTETHIQQINSFIQTDDIPNAHISKTEINESKNAYYESLEIPNITLLKDNSQETKEFKLGSSRTLPNLHVPSLNITTHYEPNMSYIIGRATLTYTTKQKIDFHVVSNKDETPSSLSPNPLAYPMNVVSIFKKEMKNEELIHPPKYNTHKKKSRLNKENEKSTNVIESINRSLIPDSSKLVKPSELISTVSGLLHSDEICEQFQRELNFIDSFFESLQYLENCSLTNNSLGEKNVENWITKSGFDVTNPEYDVLISKFENGTNIDDIETMASKSLCLLNLLIRDEQRRAKNLLLVLKMREDALKDFTKSQILWLENKKKQDNTDITTLKKKQRGALLKLQHECGEMQRMRKALLSLSEKRRLALMRTKKNIELKMKNNISADQMLLNKKKIKRSSSLERPVPLKCFDLSSSGCDESAVSRPKSKSPQCDVGVAAAAATCSPEKSIHTSHSAPPPLVDQTTDSAENNVTVDGSYLNILFHNLKLPEIFSKGKNYEVNEEALKSIVNSANSHSSANQIDIVENFIDLVKSREQDVSSSPSTARSLVEEFDQYYKDLNEDVKSPLEENSAEGSPVVGWEVINDENQKDAINDALLGLSLNVETSGINTASASSVIPNVQKELRAREKETKVSEFRCSETQTSVESALAPASVQAGPLPVPVGAPPAPAFALHTPAPETNVIFLAKSKPPLRSSIEGTTDLEESKIAQVSAPVLSSPVYSEAEELRRQQLAIEREIKALEQQQSQLLVVREIPDKPPPPYTPPTSEVRAAKPPRRFHPDADLDHKIGYYILENGAPTSQDDAYEKFLNDFCHESIEKHKEVRSDKPWDSCNLLPQKPPLSRQQLVERTSADIRDVLTCNTGPVSGVVPAIGSRRSDHIDEILFAEWRRCEPEWTALHADEVAVKGNLFEGIFQHVLSHTIDAYKNTVLGITDKKVGMPDNSSKNNEK